MTATATRREKPCLFAGPMVNAILSGRKTQTRRLIKHHLPTGPCDIRDIGNGPEIYGAGGVWLKLRLPYAVGDVLWVRETWTLASRDGYRQYAGLSSERFWPSTMDRPHVQSKWNGVHNVIYRADGEYEADTGEKEMWHPSLHMERWMSRLRLEVTAVRVERLGDITEADAYAEGVTIPTEQLFASNGNPELRNEARAAFAALWDSLSKPGFQWADNPWVAAYTFRRVETPQ